MTTSKLIFFAAIPLFLILAVATYLCVQFAVNERNVEGWVRHTYEVREQIRRISDDLDQASSGQRGYIITGEPQFLAPFHRNLARIKADVKHFGAMTADNPVQQQRLKLFERLIAQRIATMDKGVALAPPSRASPQLLASIDDGKVAMNTLRTEIDRGIAEEDRLLAQRDKARRQQETLEIAYAVGAGIVALIILLLATGLLARNNVHLKESERRRANEAAILKATLDTIRDGVAFFASDGLLCTYNDNFFRLLDFPPMLARPDAHLHEFQAVENSRRASYLTPPEPGERAFESQRAVLGERILDIYRAPVARGGFVVVAADVSARVHAENMLRQTQKMETIGHLTGGVAHDFNNLLQIISANLDLAAVTPELDAKLRDRLGNAAAAVERGARLTGQLLAFARRQALEPRSVDLGRLMQGMTELLRRTLGEQIEVESIIAGSLWNTLVDANQVENAILNLAVNARDAMPEGGKLTIEVANAYLDDNYAAQHAEVTPGQYVMLAVSDTGTGIAPDIMSRLFEPFFTTKAEGKGTGLGLAQAYGFIKQSGGHIKVYSEVGEGTTIKIYLPRTRRPRDEHEPVVAQAVQGGEESVLVVEDDAGVRTAVFDMLANLGYKVHCAENAEQALAFLETGAPVDLLFTDVVMPGAIPTREFTRRAQGLRPALLVLYTSGYTQNAIVHNGKLDEGVFLLSKPYRRDELARKIRSLFDAPRIAAGQTLDEKKRKVLVVEDDALIRMATVDMVHEAGFATAEAGDGMQALRLLDQDGDIEILLTDLGLPGMSGHQLMQEAQRLKPGLRMIVTSGYSSESEIPLEGVTYLHKPFDMARLRRALTA